MNAKCKNCTCKTYCVVSGEVKQTSPDLSNKSPKGDNDAERVCVRIYMSYHVSEMRDFKRTNDHDFIAAWEVGQQIYNSRKAVSNSIPIINDDSEVKNG